MLIGLTGPSGAHKTVVAKHLAKRHGFTRMHAGEPIKAGLRAGFGLSKVHTAGAAKDRPTMLLGGATPRAAMEAMGTGIHEVAPSATSAVMAQRIAEKLSKGQHVVVDGIRSAEEAATLRKMGGRLIRLNNGGGINQRLPMDVRQEKIKADHELDSSGSKKDLRAAADKLLAALSVNPML